MENYLFKNIRKIPTNLTCGDLIDLRNDLIEVVNCYRDILIEKKQAIGGQIFTKFEYKIFKAVNSYLETMGSHSDDITNNLETDKHLTNTTSNPWSTSPQIPTMSMNLAILLNAILLLN